jgi:hypothetical protein
MGQALDEISRRYVLRYNGIGVSSASAREP